MQTSLNFCTCTIRNSCVAGVLQPCVSPPDMSDCLEQQLERVRDARSYSAARNISPGRPARPGSPGSGLQERAADAMLNGSYMPKDNGMAALVVPGQGSFDLQAAGLMSKLTQEVEHIARDTSGKLPLPSTAV